MPGAISQPGRPVVAAPGIRVALTARDPDPPETVWSERSGYEAPDLCSAHYKAGLHSNRDTWDPG
jgi:hypothetical protein